MSKKIFFLVKNLDNETNRIDVPYFNPSYHEIIKEMENHRKNNKKLDLLPLKKILNKSTMSITGGATPKGTPYVNEDEGVKFLRVQNIRKYRINLDDVKYIPNVIHNGQLKRSQLKPKDVLLTITGTYGLSAVFPEDLGEANINQHSVRIEVDNSILIPEFLSFFLNCKYGKIQMDRLTTGGTRPALDYPSIKSIKILFPKLKKDQEIIVKKVEKFLNFAFKINDEKKKIFSEIDEKITQKLGLKLPKLNKNNFFLANLTLSDRIDANFHSPNYLKLINLIKKVNYRPLEQLVTLKIKKKPPIDDFYSLIDLRNIEEKTGRFTIKEVQKKSENNILLEDGRLYVSCLNPTKGKCLLIDKKLSGCLSSNELKSCEIKSKEVNPEYLLVILRSNLILNQWKYRVTGSTPSRERIDEDSLLNTIIPLPDESTQKDIATAVLDDINNLSALEERFQNSLIEANKIFTEELINI